MELSPVASFLPSSYLPSTADVPKATRGAFSLSSCSSCFETICQSILGLFFKAWKFLKGLFCGEQGPEIFYMSEPPKPLLSISVAIDGNNFEGLLDTGCNSAVVLKSDCLKKVSGKTFFERQDVSDALGNFSPQNAYIVREVNLAGIPFENVVIREGKEDLENCVSYLGKDGLVGLPFFEGIGSVFDDLSHKLTFNHAWGDLNLIQQNGYEWSKFVEVPLEKNKKYGLLVVPVETDFGSLKFILDTGSNVSTISASVIKVEKYRKMTLNEAAYCTLTTFKMAGKNFGMTHLALCETDSTFVDYDGILGMNFLRRQPFDLNVARGVLFIGEPKKD